MKVPWLAPIRVDNSTSTGRENVFPITDRSITYQQ